MPVDISKITNTMWLLSYQDNQDHLYLQGVKESANKLDLKITWGQSVYTTIRPKKTQHQIKITPSHLKALFLLKVQHKNPKKLVWLCKDLMEATSKGFLALKN
ncbi:hypothetical protein SERLA73DRAFT_148926 [Serpula lacrymans var. lacrymans S7.3]|uniref:Uncharacterized protein n=1 Tax=Serpula lacrymans var. lacrymans (strain S7.3) TaxID=936435 RepID=F8PGW1_SERL3|nr:hypothetical protein SERLA73DRAFT_148926 [Serpula lacrymans var. lacrymans S7.3]